MRSVALFLAALPALAQPAFEVASVRLVPGGRQGVTTISPSGSASFVATNISMGILIGVAYGTDSDRIQGLPNAVDSETYDVSAKPEGKGGLSYVELQPMLQRLLADRFHLVIHKGTKEVSGYALVVAKGGPKLKTSQTQSGRSYLLPEGLLIDNATMSHLADLLSRPTGRPVIDATGIPGNFDINLKYAREGDANSTLPSVFTALQEQLGLKLESRKVTQETVVVDHVDRVPVEN